MTRHYPRPMTHHGEKVYRPRWVGFGGHAPRNAPRGFFVALFACPARAFLPAWARFRCLFACLRACLRAFLYARKMPAKQPAYPSACTLLIRDSLFLRVPGAFLCPSARPCTLSTRGHSNSPGTFPKRSILFCDFLNGLRCTPRPRLVVRSRARLARSVSCFAL